MKSYFNFLKRNKAYALIDVLGLALSMMFVVLIGCYWWQETHIDKQHAKADRMYMVGLNWAGEKGREITLGSHWKIQPILRENFPEIETSTAIFRNNRWLKYDGEQIQTNCFFVDSTFYDIFDFELLQGDRATVLDDPRGVIVTPEYAHKVWGDVDPIGQTIIFNNNEEPFVVTGVMAPMTNTMLMTYSRTPVDMLLNFNMMKYVNSSMVSDEMNNATAAEVVLVAKEGYDLAADWQKYHDGLKEHYWILKLPEDKIRLALVPFNEVYFSGIGSSSGNFNVGNPQLIKLLFTTGIVILLFAIMNYINLTVSLAGKRAKEMATRRLLGEGRGSIMRRLIYESTLLCALSFAVGVGFAILAKPYAEGLLGVPIDMIGCINVLTVSFAVFVILVMGLASGITPALLISSVKPLDAVKGGVKRKSNMVFGKVFIVLQNVCTIVMVASAITMTMQVRHLINAPLGYDTKGILQIAYPWVEEKDEAFVSELKSLACVDKVSLCWTAPLERGNNNTMTLDGRTISFQTFLGDTCYMDLVGLKLKKDNHTTDWPKAYLNSTSLAELGIDEDAVDFPFYDRRYNIAGILEDFIIGDVLSYQNPVIVFIDKPGNDNFSPWQILVRVKGDEAVAEEQIAEVFNRIYEDGKYSAFYAEYLDQELEHIFEMQHNLSIIIVIFACIAVVIAMLGLVAMSTFYVQQRAKSIAVRKVMGSTSGAVLKSLVLSFMMYVCIAAVISVPIIFYVMNDWLSSFSYRIDLYWWIYAISIVQAFVICFLSVVLQSYRAANANPILALRKND